MERKESRMDSQSHSNLPPKKTFFPFPPTFLSQKHRHGGSKISKFLSSTLHQTFESVTPEMITDTVQYTRSHGGYFRRFNGGLLERWVVKDQLKALRGGRGSPMGREKNNLEGDGGFEKGMQDLVKGIERDPDGDGIHGRGEDAFKAEKLALENKEKEKEEKKLESSNGNDQLQENETSNHDTSSSTNSNANPGSTTTSSNTTTSPLPAIGPEAEKAKRDSKLESKKEEKELVEEARQVLQNLTKKIDVPKGMEDDSLTIAERATLACLVVSLLKKENWGNLTRFIEGEREKIFLFPFHFSLKLFETRPPSKASFSFMTSLSFLRLIDKFKQTKI